MMATNGLDLIGLGVGCHYLGLAQLWTNFCC